MVINFPRKVKYWYLTFLFDNSMDQGIKESSRRIFILLLWSIEWWWWVKGQVPRSEWQKDSKQTKIVTERDVVTSNNDNIVESHPLKLI